MQFKKRVYYHDTDCGKVVYYANYLKYFEEARTEYLKEKGVGLDELSATGITFVVRDVNIAYKAPAHYADLLEISSKIENIKSASVVFYQEVRREDQLLVNAKTTLVCVDSSFTPVVIPQKVLDCIQNSSA